MCRCISRPSHLSPRRGLYFTHTRRSISATFRHFAFLALSKLHNVQNLRICGSHEIPEELDLIDAMSRSFWVADLYGESVGVDSKNSSAVWRRAGEEIVGELRNDVSSKPLQAVLTYQRPMLENGT